MRIKLEVAVNATTKSIKSTSTGFAFLQARIGYIVGESFFSPG